MQSVFLTGGAGFLGRAILAWAAAERPDVSFTIYSRDEAKHEPVRRLYPQHRFILGDVRDQERLEFAMVGHDTVIHAAALKFVPQGESNVLETIAVNVEGSQAVALAAIRAKIKQVVGISTDKACEPFNLYGITKLMMERVFQASNDLSETNFMAVRYGNVIGSTGSVIPMFQRQAREGGPLTITFPGMTRFWLTVQEAVAYIVLALKEDAGGTVLIPALRAQTILDTAKAASLAVGGNADPEITIVGPRPGEKSHESLLSAREALYCTREPFGSLLYGMAGGPPANGDPEIFPYTSDTAKTLTIGEMAAAIYDLA